MTGSSRGKGGGRGRGKPSGVKSGAGRSGGAKSEGGLSGRGLKVRVKTAKRRSNSSARWLQRQLNDPYVAEAKKRGYRSRAAFKLLQMDEKYDFLSKARRIIDLGAAPGGWTQVSLERAAPGSKVVGIDLLEIEQIPGAILLVGDFLDNDAPDRLKAEMDGAADIVLSDMAAATIGHAKTDHLRIMGLVETALEFAIQVLAPGGSFVAKVIQGGAEQTLMDMLKRHFTKVRHVKPAASRSDSAEMYLVATGFRGPEGES
ncbi:RlmE family RNA methyltransferase [Pelagibius sp. Alg239-R121]|uniref:RlmE family RNA methyltransferase n=1 Tax=Pelagibius sp. Alg239-R121 TaxID=2993448 RepID=UPI0024A6476D|nr:RlmE family RNA methyltransferase [Pelagibius sp. Alg239-R121]